MANIAGSGGNGGTGGMAGFDGFNRGDSGDGGDGGDGGNGGILCNSDSDPNVTNCTLTYNFAGYGGYGGTGGTGIPDGENGSAGSAGIGGGIFDSNSNPTVTNSILWGDWPDEIFNDAISSSTVTYSAVLGGHAGTGNINADPCFVNAAGGNLRLGPNSPCIDAGDNNSVPADTTDLDNDGNTVESIPFDLNGFPRFVDDICTADTGNGTSPIVDMGAYEFLRSDIDSNGNVDFVDFSRLALYWLEIACGVCGGADLTCDGDDDRNDLRELAYWWLEGI
jgi:hypothetical protein